MMLYFWIKLTMKMPKFLSCSGFPSQAAACYRPRRSQPLAVVLHAQKPHEACGRRAAIITHTGTSPSFGSPTPGQPWSHGELFAGTPFYTTTSLPPWTPPASTMPRPHRRCRDWTFVEALAPHDTAATDPCPITVATFHCRLFGQASHHALTRCGQSCARAGCRQLG